MRKLFVTVGVVLILATFKMNSIRGVLHERIWLEMKELLNPQARTSICFTEIGWISQTLDHFNENEKEEFKSGFYGKDTFFESGGPMFIFVGGASENTPTCDNAGAYFCELAREHKAYLFYFEHRFYGQSKLADAMTTEKLKYLDAEQAVADLVDFIDGIKSLIPQLKQSKVVLFGYSYGGTLATWFKGEYPKLANGVWASNANLLAKVNDYERKEVFGQLIKRIGGEFCYNRIQNAIAELEAMFNENRGNAVKALLQLSESFDENNKMDVYTLFYKISSIFSTSNANIKSNCQKMMKGPTNLIAIVNLIEEMYPVNTTREMTYGSYLEALNSPNGLILRTWIYQQCNELGWFETTSSRNQPFGTKVPLEYFITLCADLFGSHFTAEYIQERIAQTNAKFGGRNLKATDVYFTYDGPEFANAYGIQDEEISATVPNLYKCNEMESIDLPDSYELKESKQIIASNIRKWVKSKPLDFLNYFFND